MTDINEVTYQFIIAMIRDLKSIWIIEEIASATGLSQYRIRKILKGHTVKLSPYEFQNIYFNHREYYLKQLHHDLANVLYELESKLVSDIKVIQRTLDKKFDTISLDIIPALDEDDFEPNDIEFVCD